MNYQRACAELTHQRTKQPLLRKKLGHQRLLHVVAPPEAPYVAIALRYFNTDIITWVSNGTIRLNNGSFWESTCTRRWMNEYLPSGYRVWREKPYWFLRAPDGLYPYHNDMCITVTEEAGRSGTAVNETLEPNIAQLVRQRSKEWTGVLCRGELSILEMSGLCSHRYCHVREAPPGKHHLLWHIRQGVPAVPFLEYLIKWGAAHVPRQYYGIADTYQALSQSCWAESRILRVTPRSKSALLRRTELEIQHQELKARPAPSDYRGMLRQALEHGMMQLLGFEKGD